MFHTKNQRLLHIVENVRQFHKGFKTHGEVKEITSALSLNTCTVEPVIDDLMLFPVVLVTKKHGFILI